MTGLSLRFAARSEIGRVRRNNEDAGYAATDLLVVADGMGGHEAGELASAATVAAVDMVFSYLQTSLLPVSVRSAIDKAAADWLRGLADE